MLFMHVIYTCYLCMLFMHVIYAVIYACYLCMLFMHVIYSCYLCMLHLYKCNLLYQIKERDEINHFPSKTLRK